LARHIATCIWCLQVGRTKCANVLFNVWSWHEDLKMLTLHIDTAHALQAAVHIMGYPITWSVHKLCPWRITIFLLLCNNYAISNNFCPPPPPSLCSILPLSPSFSCLAQTLLNFDTFNNNQVCLNGSILFAYGLFNGTFSISGHIASNNRMISEH
jgi:hypothetical protein